MEEIEENVFQAKVEGNDRYTVKIELDSTENIIDLQFDCPYDLGEYCKHQVAVLLKLRGKKGKNTTLKGVKTEKTL